jgi:hypothetical protein
LHWPCKTYSFFLVASELELVSLEPDVAPELAPPDGVPPAALDPVGGVPLAALEPEAEPAPLAGAPPAALDPVGGVPLAALLEELLSAELEEGEDGVVALPDALPLEVPPAEDDGAPGLVAADLSPPPLSQLVNIVAPSARETATAMAESLINGPPWVGVQKYGSKDWAASQGARRHVCLTRVL